MDTAKTDFLAQKSLAVVGVSKSGGFGAMAFRELRKRGYQVFPVGRTADNIDGQPCAHSLDELPQKVDAVVTIVPPAETEKVLDDCARLGIHHVWMQQGSESPAAVEKAKTLGLSAVPGGCVLMYADPHSFHRAHAWVWKVLGKA